MATVEHCLFCFEALAAELEDRKPMTLPEIYKSWADYVRSTTDADDADTNKLSKALPALQRLKDASSSSSGSTSSSASNSTLSLGATTPATTSSSTTSPPEPVTESPLFVTWNITSPRHTTPVLRGCIGTFEAQPLSSGLSSYALISALQDTRFDPVALHELPSLSVSVTLLTDFEDAADAMDWALGTHGLRIAFHERGKRYGATYLPDVAVEQGWTKEETVVSLMRKAGWMGRKDRWEEVGLSVVRYQGRKESLGYGEFKRWREWAEGN
ncbi:AMMECR1 domain-containing protein [Staphylotrichum tortipilum]|uniref:AMMECR1 domain-containing protein n=1 Tax=Staphylotrichum tortipilum TaxID=2831512 RepID=A0AAN6MDE0_9PEZI|nr:AMMECR1 domain-containing protein [Staphylotrichum longicolle]